MRDLDPDVAEFIIGRAFARPVGSSGLRLLTAKRYGPPLLRGQRPIGACRANPLSQLIELAGLVGGPVGCYDFDVPAAGRYQFGGFLQRSWNRPPVEGDVSRRILRNNQKPHVIASRRKPPTILAWRAPASRA